METYPQEIREYQAWNQESTAGLDPEVRRSLTASLHRIRRFGNQYPRLHFCLQLFPVLFLTSLAVLVLRNLSVLESMGSRLVLLTLAQGILGYQFVVYALHEGAGHSLLRSHSWVRWLVFHSSRLFFADPDYYRERHQRHHRYLGSEDDGAFTHFVLPGRIVKSLLPGAGILFRNDYQIARDERWTQSGAISLLVGIARVSLDIFLIGDQLPVGWSLVCLLVLVPWVGMILDRTRESLEHFLMPADSQLGSWELGLSPLGILLGGGPWGQPCHFAHHYAPDLNWYQQLWFHRLLKRDLPSETQTRFGLNGSPSKRLLEVSRFYWRYWRSQRGASS